MKEKTKNFNIAMFVYFVIVVCFVGLRTLSAFGLLDFMGAWGNIFFTVIVQIVLMFCGSVILFSALKKQKVGRTFGDFGYKKVSGKIIWLSVGLGAVVFFLNIFVSSTFNSIIELLGYEHSYSPAPSSYSFGSLILNLIFTALLPAVCEETAHRGMLLKSMHPMGSWKAIWLSAILFGMLHLNIEQFFYATLIGVFLGVLTLLSNSIVPAMIVHFMNNALSTYLLFSQVNALPFGKAFSAIENAISSNLIVGILIVIAILLALAYLLAVLTKKILHLSMKREFASASKELGKRLMKEAYLADLENEKSLASGKEIDLEKLDKGIENIKNFILQDFDAEPFHPPKIGALLLFGSLLLGGVLTVFTFVWGAL